MRKTAPRMSLPAGDSWPDLGPESGATLAHSGGPRLDPRAYLATGGEINESDLRELLCTDQVERWRAGHRVPAEAYLSLHATLQGESESAFELIYGEYVLRE